MTPRTVWLVLSDEFLEGYWLNLHSCRGHRIRAFACLWSVIWCPMWLSWAGKTATFFFSLSFFCFVLLSALNPGMKDLTCWPGIHWALTAPMAPLPALKPPCWKLVSMLLNPNCCQALYSTKTRWQGGRAAQHLLTALPVGTHSCAGADADIHSSQLFPASKASRFTEITRNLWPFCSTTSKLKPPHIREETGKKGRYLIKAGRKNTSFQKKKRGMYC